MQSIDAISHCGDHALDLMVFAFGQGQAQLGRCSNFGSRSGNWLRLIVEQHASQQLINLRLIQRVAGGRQINLGHLALSG